MGWIQKRILEELGKKPCQSRVELLCNVYGFRTCGSKILGWSILDRQFLDQQEDDKATDLLRKVLQECESIGLPEDVERKEEYAGKRVPPKTIVIPAKKPYPTLPLALFEAVEGLALGRDREVAHPYHVANKRIRIYLDKWSWGMWQKLPTESAIRESGELDGLRRKIHVSMTGALKGLVNKGKIIVNADKYSLG